MSTFPTSLDNLPESHVDNVGEKLHAGTINDLASAVNAIETVAQPVVNGITADVTAANLNTLTGGSQTSLHSHTDQERTITLIIDNSVATGTDPDFFFEGSLGDTVSVDWGDGHAETFALLGYDPTGNLTNAVEATRTYSDGQDAHAVVITGTNLAVLDFLSLSFKRPAGSVYSFDFRWLRGPADGSYLELDCANSGIAPLVSGLTNLQQLALGTNQLTVTPDLSGLTGLRNLSLFNNQLTEDAVNTTLAQCVVIEAAVPRNRHLELRGGTNHAPTGQGLTDKATLITAGWTVTTN